MYIHAGICRGFHIRKAMKSMSLDLRFVYIIMILQRALNRIKV